jgi:hypothetical protein
VDNTDKLLLRHRLCKEINMRGPPHAGLPLPSLYSGPQNLALTMRRNPHHALQMVTMQITAAVRHGRACPGHLRLSFLNEDMDARDKRGHDGADHPA